MPEPQPDWREVKIHFGKKNDTKLGDLDEKSLRWWKENWQPNSQFCKSKLTQTIEHPESVIPAWTEQASYDEDFGPEPEVQHPASIRPAWTQTVRLPDPAKCADCALRAALDAVTFEPEKPAGPLAGEHLGAVGDKITVAATVEAVREYETKFHNKKVVTALAILRTEGGAVVKWTSSAMPAGVVEGAALTITGAVKAHGDYEGERNTTLTRCKVAGAVKLAPTHGLVLFCDAKANTDGYAFCAADGIVLEYGKICPALNLEFWPGYHGEQSNAEVCAALIAFNFARMVKEAAGLECLALDFRFDAQWMKGMVGKAKPLRDFARAHKLVVTMNWISGTENPADEWTTAAGSKFVDNTTLAEFAAPIGAPPSAAEKLAAL